jgi:RNA polymerase sigma factor (sigma-70 family)
MRKLLFLGYIFSYQNTVRRMTSITQADARIISDILAGGQSRMEALRIIYQNRKLKDMVSAFVKNNKGSAEDGQDVFHDGIIILDQNIRAGKFRGESPLDGYLYSICRFAWMNRMRKQARTVYVETPPTADEAPAATSPEAIILDEERKNVLNRLMSSIGERCAKILELWKLSYSMEEIAEQLGFSSADMARKAKYRCHLALLEQIKSNPHWEALLR